jgi:hypothetical protein
MRHRARPGPIRHHDAMPPTIPESTKTSIGQRLRQRQRQRWPGLAGVTVRFRGRFAYIDGELEDGEILPLCRLRYSGSASLWGLPSTWPAEMGTRTRSCQAACRWVSPRRPWTVPAGCT